MRTKQGEVTKGQQREVFKETFIKTKTRNQTLAHKNSLAGNGSIEKTGSKEYQYTDNFAYSSLLLYFDLFFDSKTLLECFL